MLPASGIDSSGEEVSRLFSAGLSVSSVDILQNPYAVELLGSKGF